MQSALLPAGVRAALRMGVGDGGGIESMAQISPISHFDPPESFPQCDFEDEAHPFCDWVQVLQDGGHWTQGSKNTLIQGTGPLGASLNGGEETEDPSSQRVTESAPSEGVDWCDWCKM